MDALGIESKIEKYCTVHRYFAFLLARAAGDCIGILFGSINTSVDHPLSGLTVPERNKI
jgi:hypothetical protein